LNVNEAKVRDTAYYEKRAKKWDRWTTISILLILLLPFPFAHFEAWPSGAVISEHIIMPWSQFRLCYISYPERECVEEEYGFTWKGEILPRHLSSPAIFILNSSEPPLLKWQSTPDLVLKEVFLQGEFLKLKTLWQPLLLWPLKMGLMVSSH